MGLAVVSHGAAPPETTITAPESAITAPESASTAPETTTTVPETTREPAPTARDTNPLEAGRCVMGDKRCGTGCEAHDEGDAGVVWVVGGADEAGEDAAPTHGHSPVLENLNPKHQTRIPNLDP